MRVMKQRFSGRNHQRGTALNISEYWWEAEDLTISEAVLLTEIERLGKYGDCVESNAYFAEFMGLSKSRASEFIGRLKEKGYIRTQYGTDTNGINYRIIRLTR